MPCLSSVILDPVQQQVLDYDGHKLLVLGAPGTGKTTLLLRALLQARTQEGIPAQKMLCLTSGLSAQQGYSQLQNTALTQDTEAIFVGQIHDFARAFLYANHCIAEGTRIIDKEERLYIVRQIFEAHSPNEGKTENWEAQRVVDYANRIREEQHNIPFALRKYQYADMRFKDLAENYLQFLHDHCLLDADALLFTAYEKMVTDTTDNLQLRNYDWITVDEVQDFAPLHLAFVDLLKSTQARIRYFADEHQSCCSNRGADRYGVEKLSQDTELKILRLPYDYRSPAQNLELLRTYAPYVAQIPTSALGENPPTRTVSDEEDALSIVYCTDLDEQHEIIAAQARSLSEDATEESTAILLRTEQEVHQLSQVLDAHYIAHFSSQNTDSSLQASHLSQHTLLVMTTQEAKGLEFDNVLLCNATADVYPLFYLSDKSEDARLLYVGMSRARKRLFVSYHIEPSYYLASPRVYNRFYELPDIQKHLLIKMERRIAEAEAEIRN